MGIDVKLKAENGELLGQVADGQSVLSAATRSTLSETVLLKYLMPWGDAVFNQSQATDLEHDIQAVISAHPGTPLARLVSNLLPLVERLHSEAHLYLWFVGD